MDSVIVGIDDDVVVAIDEEETPAVLELSSTRC